MLHETKSMGMKEKKQLKVRSGKTKENDNVGILFGIKPWTNDHNISTQDITTLLVLHYFTSCGQMIAAFERNIFITVGCNMLYAFGHPVVTCCDLLRPVECLWLINLKNGQSFYATLILWMLHNVVHVVAWPGLCSNVAPGHAHYM